MTKQSDPVFATFVAVLLDTLAKIVPGTGGDAQAANCRRDFARLLFDAFEPRDVMEAMLAARAVAAHAAIMDS